MKEKYPMCDEQIAQIDCRLEKCKYHKYKKCNNIAPAITLNENKTFVCWSYKDKQKECDKNDRKK